MSPRSEHPNFAQEVYLSVQSFNCQPRFMSEFDLQTPAAFGMFSLNLLLLLFVVKFIFLEVFLGQLKEEIACVMLERREGQESVWRLVKRKVTTIYVVFLTYLWFYILFRSLC